MFKGNMFELFCCYCRGLHRQNYSHDIFEPKNYPNNFPELPPVCKQDVGNFAVSYTGKTLEARNCLKVVSGRLNVGNYLLDQLLNKSGWQIWRRGLYHKGLHWLVFFHLGLDALYNFIDLTRAGLKNTYIYESISHEIDPQPYSTDVRLQNFNVHVSVPEGHHWGGQPPLPVALRGHLLLKAAALRGLWGGLLEGSAGFCGILRALSL